jgi:type I restriction enzyme, S subunit
MAETFPAFPVDWSVCSVEDAGDVIAGQAKKADNVGRSRPYLRVANVQDDNILVDDIATMPILNPERHQLSEGDILLCGGQSRELAGRAAMFSGYSQHIYFQNHILRFRANDGVVPEYALHVFRAYQKTGVFASIATGTTGLANLGLNRFRSLAFPLPPTPVQREIAAICRAMQNDIDVIRASVAELAQLAEELIPNVISKEIIGDQQSESIDELLSEVPWPTAIAEEVVESSAPIVYGILQPGPIVDEGVPYIRGQDLQQGRILVDQLRRASTDVASRHARSSLQAGDVLLGIIRHTRVAIVPEELEGAQITQGTARLRPKSDLLDAEFLYYWLTSSVAQRWLRSRMRGIDMPGLNLKDVRQLPVPVPSMENQRRIVDQLNSATSSIELVMQAARQSLRYIDALEAAALANLSYGQLGAAVSRRILDGEVRKQASELAEQLGVSVDAAPKSSASHAPNRTSRPPRRSMKGNGMVSGRLSGAAETSPMAVLSALETLGGPCPPESLFAQLGVSQDAVDSFYVALRHLHDIGEIRVLRPNKADVTVELVDR